MLTKIILLSAILATGARGTPADGFDFFDATVGTWFRCSLSQEPSLCLEARTIRQIREIDVGENLTSSAVLLGRDGKSFDEADGEVRALQEENAKLLSKIEGSNSQPRGLLDYVTDFFANGLFKSLGGVFDFGDSEEDGSEEDAAEQDQGNPIKGRGHKKKYLKKQNKHLKLILILMLIKNKIKMFLHKFQFLVQLKFLGIALANLLINAIRLWLELKKKHKPHKVIYYEKSHHQHHYDNEHIHDDPDDHYYTRPGSYTHHSHHEDEHEGGGIWPWSRSYVERPSDAYNTIPYRGSGMYSHNLAYMNQRPIR